MTILIDTVRIANFRGIKEVEVNLSPTTLLVGANNAGKTSFLKALHLALGADRRSLSKEDFHDDGSNSKPDSNEILIDIRIVPYNFEHKKRQQNFEDNWAQSDFSGLIKTDNDDMEFVSFRTRGLYDILKGYVFESLELQNWDNFKAINDDGEVTSSWKETRTQGKFKKIDSIPLFFIDAQRDIQLDLKDRSSYLGKLTERLEIDDLQIKAIERQLNILNSHIVDKSPILEHLKTTLLELSKTVNSQGTGVEISPISKKIRDIGRNLNINFKDTDKESLPLDYHGMGTRSWASVLTLNAFISWNENTKNTNKKDPFFPIIALEEPESHLHPNAQRHLFKQLNEIKGQKIISTHSPFVAAQSELTDLRHFYKDNNGLLSIGKIELSDNDEEEIRILLEEIEQSPTDKEIIKNNSIKKGKILERKQGKIKSEDYRKIKREVMNTRGELLFAKAIILFEGETEEQALPIFAEKHFGNYPFELGLNFIGVGGKNKYTPFLSIAKFLNIPWFIFSDADHDTVSEVKAQIKNVFGKENNYNPKLIDLGNGNDFEKYLISEGFSALLIKSINDIEGDNYFPEEYIKKYNDQKGKGDTIRNYTLDFDGGIERALLDCLSGDKTKYPSQIAENITSLKGEDGKSIIPIKIKELFDAINSELKIQENEL